MHLLKIGKHKLQITHKEKILFPKSKITKEDLINYYLNIAEFMIPHIKNRPIMMHRFIEGINNPENPGFFQKNISEYFPDWIDRAKIEKRGGEYITQVLCNNPETLIYITNQLCITVHTWLSKADNKCKKINYPDKLIFDLDPSEKSQNFEKTGFLKVIEAAKIIKKFLESLGLTPFVMTTGSKGLHIVVPIKRENKFEYVKKFSHDCAIILEKQNPELFTNEMRKEKRENKIFLDIYRNAYAQTSVAPYSVRAIEGAPVATPILWREVNKNLTAQKFNIKNIFTRIKKLGDVWQNFEENSVSIKLARKKLDLILKKFKET